MGAQGINAVLALVQAVLIARALGAAEYGVMVLVTTFTLTINQVFGCRIWEALTHFVPRYREQDENRRAAAVVQLAYLIEAVAGVLAISVVLLSAGLAEDLLIKEPGAASLVRLYSIMILLLIPQEATIALLRTANRFQWLSAHTIAVGLLKLLAIGIAWGVGPTARSMLLAQLVAVAVGLVILWVMGWLVAAQTGLPLGNLSALWTLRGQFREVLRFTFLTNLVGTSRILTANADTLVLGFVGTPAAVGVYELAKKLVSQLQLFANGIYEATYPEISSLIARGDNEVVSRLQSGLSRVLLVAVVPFCLACNLFSAWVIPLLFGPAFSLAVLPFNILVWQLLWLPLVWFPGFLLAIGRARTLAALSWLDAAIFVLLLIALVPGLDAAGAAWAMFLRNLIWISLALGVLRNLRKSSKP